MFTIMKLKKKKKRVKSCTYKNKLLLTLLVTVLQNINPDRSHYHYKALHHYFTNMPEDHMTIVDHWSYRGFDCIKCHAFCGNEFHK